ncbi:MAG: hypothetical protein AB8F78_14135 [Saprospiraceae bacterium]
MGLAKKQYIGLGLIILSVLLAKFMNLDSIGTGSIAVLMAFGALAWVGIVMAIPNESGENFKLWKMLLKGAFGMAAMIGILALGLTSTKSYIETELRDYGVNTTAVIMETETTTLPAKRGKVNYIYYATVQFKDENGKTRVRRSEIGKHELTLAQAGKKIAIRYSSRNPDVHKLNFY